MQVSKTQVPKCMGGIRKYGKCKYKSAGAENVYLHRQYLQVCTYVFRILAFSTTANSYLRSQHLYFPSVYNVLFCTYIFHICVYKYWYDFTTFQCNFPVDDMLFHSSVICRQVGKYCPKPGPNFHLLGLKFYGCGHPNFWPNFSNYAHFLTYVEVWWQSVWWPPRLRVEKEEWMNEWMKRQQQDIIPPTHLSILISNTLKSVRIVAELHHGVVRSVKVCSAKRAYLDTSGDRVVSNRQLEHSELCEHYVNNVNLCLCYVFQTMHYMNTLWTAYIN